MDACCAYPREGGEPMGKSLDAMIGGMPCKHLQWVETDPPKLASAEYVSSVDQEMARMISEIIEDM